MNKKRIGKDLKGSGPVFAWKDWKKSRSTFLRMFVFWRRFQPVVILTRIWRLTATLTRSWYLGFHWRRGNNNLSSLENIDIQMYRVVQNIFSGDTGISWETEGNPFGDHLISRWVCVTPSSVIKTSVVLGSVSLWLVRVNVQSACALNTRYTLVFTGDHFSRVGWSKLLRRCGNIRP
jgi:hypothetical protein